MPALAESARIDGAGGRADDSAMIHASLGKGCLTMGYLCSLLVGQAMVTGPFVPGPGVWVGDVNGDGVDDLLLDIGGMYEVVDPTTNTAFAFLQRGSGGSAKYFGVGDYDGDGRDDLAHVLPSFSTIVSGFDGSTLLTSSTMYVTGGGDFDGDGRSDLMMIEAAEVRVRSARTGALLFQHPFSPASTGPIYTQILPVGDEDGDGLEDALMTHFFYAYPGYWMQLVRSPGTIAGIWGDARAVGDVNGDGRADILSSPASQFSPGPPRVYAGGSLASFWTVAGAADGAAAARTGDVDGDGFSDIAVRIGATNQLLSGATRMAMASVPISELPKLLGDLDGDGRSESVMFGLRYEWSDPALPAASRMSRRGTPGTTNDGRRPYLVTRGHCGLGRTAFFDMRGGLPGGLTLLMFGDAVDADLTGLGAPSNHLYTSLAGGLAFVADGKGVAQYQATMPPSATLIGASLSLQAVVVDPAANALGLVTSNAVDITTYN